MLFPATFNQVIVYGGILAKDWLINLDQEKTNLITALCCCFYE